MFLDRSGGVIASGGCLVTEIAFLNALKISYGDRKKIPSKTVSCGVMNLWRVYSFSFYGDTGFVILQVMHFNLTELIYAFGPTAGYVLLTAIIFAESGLFFGFFLPGDSLLFTAGFLASQGFFNIAILTFLMATAAILGDSVGYWFGKKVGKKLFVVKEDSRLFKKKYLVEAHKFYEKHGGKTIFLARFIPAVRTFAPIVAGAADMTYRQFLSYNVFGGLVWGAGLTLGGYFLGRMIPSADKYLLPIIIIIVVASVLPGVWHALSDSETRAHLKTALVNFVYALPGLNPNRKS